MIKVKEYWPTFADRDEDTRMETVVEDEADICLIPWLVDKFQGCLRKDARLQWDKYGGFVMKREGRQWWIMATLERL